jgi:hypothetical protein
MRRYEASGIEDGAALTARSIDVKATEVFGRLALCARGKAILITLSFWCIWG